MLNICQITSDDEVSIPTLLTPLTTAIVLRLKKFKYFKCGNQLQRFLLFTWKPPFRPGNRTAENDGSDTVFRSFDHKGQILCAIVKSKEKCSGFGSIGPKWVLYCYSDNPGRPLDRFSFTNINNLIHQIHLDYIGSWI